MTSKLTYYKVTGKHDGTLVFIEKRYPSKRRHKHICSQEFPEECWQEYKCNSHEYVDRRSKLHLRWEVLTDEEVAVLKLQGKICE